MATPLCVPAVLCVLALVCYVDFLFCLMYSDHIKFAQSRLEALYVDNNIFMKIPA